ncbi:hypothetical protein H0H87_003672, partial [Tephrocybe sp. NHM501043]
MKTISPCRRPARSTPWPISSTLHQHQHQHQHLLLLDLSAPATSFSPLSLASSALQRLAKSPRMTPVLGKDMLTH